MLVIRKPETNIQRSIPKTLGSFLANSCAAKPSKFADGTIAMSDDLINSLGFIIKVTADLQLRANIHEEDSGRAKCMAMAAGTKGHNTLTHLDAVHVLRKHIFRKSHGWMPLLPLSPSG